MKILHVIPTLSPRYGGPTRVCLEITARLSKAGHEVAIFTTNRDYPSGVLAAPVGRPVDRDGVSVTYFPVEIPGLLVSMAMATALSRQMPGWDLVHIHGLYRFPLAAAAHYARKFNVPYLIRPHGSLDPYLYYKRERRLLKRVYERLVEFPNLNRAAMIHYTTEEEMRRAEFLGFRSPGVVIPNGLETGRFASLPEAGSFRREYGLGDKKIIMHLGRVARVKGLDILVAAFAALAKERDDVVLAVVGPDIDGFAGEVRTRLRELGVEDRAVFTGMLVDGDKLAALRDADIFALPSYTESFGMAVVEAMAAGLPVVISDQVKIWREVRGAGAGLVTRCDPAEVARALRCLIDDPARRHRMGAAGRARVAEKFGWDAVIDRLLAAYGAALGTAGRPTDAVVRIQ